MSLSGKVFILAFVVIASVMFVGVVAYVTSHNAPADVTIASVNDAYYNASQQANQTINQTLRYGEITTASNSWIPLFVALGVVFSGLFLLLLAVKKR